MELCLTKGWTGYGYKTIEMEEKWKEFTGLPHAHFLNSNTSGLHLAIKILKDSNKWMDGDEIITTPLTFGEVPMEALRGRPATEIFPICPFAGLCFIPTQTPERLSLRRPVCGKPIFSMGPVPSGTRTILSPTCVLI